MLTGHLVAYSIPRTVLLWNGHPLRLYVLEASALAFGFLTLWGLSMLIYRRFTNARIRAVTSPMDVVLLLALLTQVVAGLWIAIFYRWGSSWYSAFAVPYLNSLLLFRPDVALVSNLPFMVDLAYRGWFCTIDAAALHAHGASVGLPYAYLWRPYQVVIWNRRQTSQK
ncbi:MAG: respiratory nitrate reductase subunit gamma [Chloroflexi bacterium]|nr:respiratory nitrate reductase subunit gamma [Chloroflexota bacterium]